MRVKVGWKNLGEDACKVHCSDNMFKPSVISSGIDEFRPGELAQSSESLYGSSINYCLFGFADPDVAVDRVLDEAPSLGHDGSFVATAYSKLREMVEGPRNKTRNSLRRTDVGARRRVTFSSFSD